MRKWNHGKPGAQRLEPHGSNVDWRMSPEPARKSFGSIDKFDANTEASLRGQLDRGEISQFEFEKGMAWLGRGK